METTEFERCSLKTHAIRYIADNLATGASRSHIGRMVRISISPQAFAAIASTLPLGSVAVEPERAADGGVGIRLDHATVAKLKALRGPGESYSDVIVALAAATAG